MPSHAWQWTNEELELFIGNFGSKLQRGWGSVGVELSWVELSWVGFLWGIIGWGYINFPAKHGLTKKTTTNLGFMLDASKNKTTTEEVWDNSGLQVELDPVTWWKNPIGGPCDFSTFLPWVFFGCGFTEAWNHPTKEVGDHHRTLGNVQNPPCGPSMRWESLGNDRFVTVFLELLFLAGLGCTRWY